MSECGCDREIGQLRDELDMVRRDLERTIQHLEDRVQGIRSDVDDMAVRA